MKEMGLYTWECYMKKVLRCVKTPIKTEAKFYFTNL